MHIPTNKGNKILKIFYRKMSLRAQIVKMGVGEQLTIPVAEYGYTTIRSYASDLGFAYNRKYSTKRNRQERTYTIVRNK